jgi:histidinol dehydrogenase
MKTILYPERDIWNLLCSRPLTDNKDIEDVTRDIINTVRSERDKALYFYSSKFDNTAPGNLKVSHEEILEGAEQISVELKYAINIARLNIENFHSSQIFTEPVIEAPHCSQQC